MYLGSAAASPEAPGPEHCLLLDNTFASIYDDPGFLDLSGDSGFGAYSASIAAQSAGDQTSVFLSLSVAAGESLQITSLDLALLSDAAGSATINVQLWYAGGDGSPLAPVTVVSGRSTTPLQASVDVVLTICAHYYSLDLSDAQMTLLSTSTRDPTNYALRVALSAAPFGLSVLQWLSPRTSALPSGVSGLTALGYWASNSDNNISPLPGFPLAARIGGPPMTNTSACAVTSTAYTVMLPMLNASMLTNEMLVQLRVIIAQTLQVHFHSQ
jgi:hypothetical protein